MNTLLLIYIIYFCNCSFRSYTKFKCAYSIKPWVLGDIKTLHIKGLKLYKGITYNFLAETRTNS